MRTKDLQQIDVKKGWGGLWSSFVRCRSWLWLKIEEDERALYIAGFWIWVCSYRSPFVAFRKSKKYARRFFSTQGVDCILLLPLKLPPTLITVGSICRLQVHIAASSYRPIAMLVGHVWG
jgi:hypothetical protein